MSDREGNSLVGRKNIYVCQGCNHAIVTVDRDEGTTPFTIKCRGGCGTGMMYSEFYRVPQELHAAWEWYRATDAAVRAMPPGCWDHHRQGGLFLRERDVGDAAKMAERDLTKIAAIAREQKIYLDEFEKPKSDHPGNRHERRRAAKLAR